MSLAIPNIHVGDPLCHEALSIFPIFIDIPSKIEYLLSDEAIASGATAVKEISHNGSVPELLVENHGDLRVLFLEGEELVGAKQNRILNTSVLVAPKSTTVIPVSCVEAGRWSHMSRGFRASGSHSPSKLRYYVKSSVSHSLRESGQHRSDQHLVWKEVARQQDSLKTPSRTHAMSDTFLAYEERIVQFRNSLRYVTESSGVAVAIGVKVACIDVFDKAVVCRKAWNRLLSGFVLDALESNAGEGKTSAQEVEQLWSDIGAAVWERSEPIGDGEEVRAEIEGRIYASALTFLGLPLHMSVLTAC
jgi:hypothetical protein